MTDTATELTSKLWSIDDVSNLLQSTENLSSVTLSMDGSGDQTAFSLPPGWNIGLKDKDPQDLTDAKVGIGTTEYLLTKEAALGIAHAVGLPPAYVAKTPGVLIQSHLNYWATHSPEASFKMLVKDDKVLAITKESIKPFSNLELLERTLQSIYDRYEVDDSDLYVDYKSHHDLHVTNLRIIIPEESRQIDAVRNGTAVEDMWSGGVQVRNSLTGKIPLSVQGYLFGWAETNAAIMQHAVGKYNRKTMGQDIFEVYDWVGESVAEVLDSVEHEFDVVSTLTEESIADGVSKVLADIFKTYKVPLKTRQPIMDHLVESEDYTYYGVLNAITSTANVEGLPHHFVTAIMEIGGDIAAQAHTRCQSCKRVLV